MADNAGQTIESLLREDRTFPPSAEFTAKANAKPGIHEEAGADPVGYWAKEAFDRVTW